MQGSITVPGGSGSTAFGNITGWPGDATDFVRGDGSAAPVSAADISAAGGATLTGTQTLSGKTLTAPKLVNGGFIADANGNESIICVTTGSAVNEVTVTNAATANAPKIAASGGDTNINLALQGKGTGNVNLLSPISFPSAHTTPGSGFVGVWASATSPYLQGAATGFASIAAGTGGTAPIVYCSGASSGFFSGCCVLDANSDTIFSYQHTQQGYWGPKGWGFTAVSSEPAKTITGSFLDSNNAMYLQGGGGALVNAARLVSRANSTAYGICLAPTGDVIRALFQDSSSKRAVALVDASGTVTFEAGSHADYVASSSPASGEVGVYVSSGVLTIKPGSAGTRSIAANVARAQA